jgi:CelD/BcsL family acetyltransferase involved in cellulose biosynthesis
MASARLSVITTAAGPIAFALCLLHQNRLYLLKTGYDERHHQLSPGLVMHWAIIDRCHQLGHEAYELLGSADPWKLQLATGDRPISRLIAHKNSPAGRARAGIRRLRPIAKKLHSHVTPPPRHRM